MSRGGRAAAMLGVAILAFLARAAYLHEAESIPLHHVLISDGRAYSEWAQEIAVGDLMGRSRGVFYQAPLYPYLLALVYRVGGEGLLAIRIVQMVFGIAASMLMVVAGRSFFSMRAGLVAGVLLALYPPAIFFDGMIQKTSLAVFLLTALLASMGGVYRKATRLRWFVLGLLLGLLVLTRENALLLLPVLMLWSCTHPTPGWRRRAAVQLGCFLAGVALVLLPVALRNLSVGGVFALTTAQAGPNFYIGNHPGASGTYEPLRRGRSDTPFERRDAVDLAEAAEGRPLDSGAVSKYWTGQALEFIRAEPLSWLGLVGRKTGMVLHRYELPDAHDLELYSGSSRTLRWLGYGLHAGTVVPLGLLGFLLVRSRWRDLWPLGAAFFVLLAGVVLFFVLARYRMPVVVVAILLAGAAVDRIVFALHRGASDLGSLRRQGVTVGLVAAIAVLVSNGPIEMGRTSNLAMAKTNLGVALVDLERWGEAAAAYREALELDPTLLEAHLNLGSLLRVLGQSGPAVEHLKEAHRLAPQDPDVAHELARVSIVHGDLVTAEVHLRSALQRYPERSDIRAELAEVLERQGRPLEAAGVLRH